MDFVSARAYDRDGRLKVSRTNITRAAVNPYLGSEIPGGDALGLDPDRIYRLWRHPDEVAAAAGSFNDIPLLARHVPVSADDHKPNDVVGAVGSNARFAKPFLENSLVVWASSAIRAIEDRSSRELSACYYYKPKMGAGITPEGEAYDAIMTQLQGNHVALVPAGRAGPDVAVNDGMTWAVNPHFHEHNRMFPNRHRLKQ